MASTGMPSTEERALRSTAASWVIQVARLGVNLLARLVLLRLILPEGHGIYELALRIVTVAAAIRDLGLPYQLVRDPRKPYGTAATADKYLEQIKQKVAESKASVEVATGSLDTERIKLERKGRELQAQSVLNEFEIEMGLKKPDVVKEAAPFGTGGETTPQAQGTKETA